MNVTFEYGKMRFDLVLSGKYNVIVGDSGTGKTQLARFASLLEKQGIRDTNYEYKIYGTPANLSWVLREVSNAIVVIDETLNPSAFDALLPDIKESNNYFIFCFREDLGNLNYGVDNVFEMMGNANHRIMRPYFTKNYFPRTVGVFSTIITEDFRSSYYALCSRFPEVNVISSFGKDNLCKVIESSSADTVVIMDLCGIGCSIFRVLTATRVKGCIIFRTKSFEHEVLLKVFAIDDPSYPEKVWLAKPNEEKFYEEQLDCILQKIVGIPYSKFDKEIINLLAGGQCCYRGKGYDLGDYGFSCLDLYSELKQHLSGSLGTLHLDG